MAKFRVGDTVRFKPRGTKIVQNPPGIWSVIAYDRDTCAYTLQQGSEVVRAFGMSLVSAKEFVR